MIKYFIKFILDELKDIWCDIRRFALCENPFHTIFGRRFKYIYQWLKSGFSDREIWNLDDTIAKFIIPRLKRLKEIGHGVPHKKKLDGTFKYVDEVDEFGSPIALTEDEWNNLIDKMIFAFEFTINSDRFIDWPKDYNFGFTLSEGKVIFNDSRGPNYDRFNDAYKKYEEGMMIFATYYNDLWD